MVEWLHMFFLSFIPLFVAMDAPGIAPVFVALTEGLSDRTRNELVTQATLTALLIAIGFMAVGNVVFKFLGITDSDFRIAGGLVLVILSVVDLVFSQAERRKPSGHIGVVPIGIPLIMGPAAMTTILILLDSYGYVITISSLLANLVAVWITFRYAGKLLGLIGPGGAKAIAKIASLFLAAIGVMMIRVGITAIINAN
ncbi:MAG: MarC family protein [Bdellovibrionaceae bacterium]|nr:MarC family protein [Pseudobdellovibrionaceae bacterium]